MKVFVIMDGLGDKACPQLQGLTPLQYAKIPYLDKIAAEGQSGYVSIINSQLAPESDVAVMTLLGYDPFTVYPGRGPLEALGADITLHPGDLAMRANFATILNKKLVDRRVGRCLTTKEAVKLASTLNKDIDLGYPFLFQPTIQHRGVFIVRGSFSPHISNVDPGYEKHGSFGVVKQRHSLELGECRAMDRTKEAAETARVVNLFVKKSYDILHDHPINQKRKKKMMLPANIVLLRDAGVGLPRLEQRSGWAAVVSMPLEKGIAKITGMHVYNVPVPPLKHVKIKKYLVKCLDKEIAVARNAFKKKKFTHYYIHFKETDIPGHDGDPLFKVALLERLDKKFFKFLWKLGCEVVITGDHSTPCTLKMHSADPVPLVWKSSHSPDTVMTFDDVACRHGSLGKLFGKDVLKRVSYL